MKRAITSVALLALLAAACGTDEASDTTDASTTTTTTPDGTPMVLLQMSEEGGFMMVQFALNRPPTYTLLTDGTLIFQGPQPGAFPGPVLPGMQQTTLTADQMNDIQVLIEAAGLPDVDDLVNDEANAIVADATSTVAVYTDPGGDVHRISIYALGFGEDLSDEMANLQLLRATLEKMAFSASSDPYASDELIIRTLEGGGVGEEFTDVRPWTFDFEPNDANDPQNQFPCYVLTGSDASAARAFLVDASMATQWEHESGTFGVLGRDLLPGEAGCESQ
ncbi:MAG: hypothetical protein GY720_01500 [bacterium]|nr:hypothetical protein [bacterium]